MRPSLLGCLLLAAACARAAPGGASPGQAVAGDPARGKAAIVRYGCTACHAVPGIRGGRANVGPTLRGIGTRAYIAGVLPNSPAALARFVRDPQGVDPQSAMPDTGVTEADARDIAAYLAREAR